MHVPYTASITWTETMLYGHCIKAFIFIISNLQRYIPCKVSVKVTTFITAWYINTDYKHFHISPMRQMTAVTTVNLATRWTIKLLGSAIACQHKCSTSSWKTINKTTNEEHLPPTVIFCHYDTHLKSATNEYAISVKKVPIFPIQKMNTDGLGALGAIFTTNFCKRTWQKQLKVFLAI